MTLCLSLSNVIVEDLLLIFIEPLSLIGVEVVHPVTMGDTRHVAQSDELSSFPQSLGKLQIVSLQHIELTCEHSTIGQFRDDQIRCSSRVQLIVFLLYVVVLSM